MTFIYKLPIHNCLNYDDDWNHKKIDYGKDCMKPRHEIEPYSLHRKNRAFPEAHKYDE